MIYIRMAPVVLMKAAHDMEAYDTFMDTEGDMWTTGVMARYNSTEKHVRKIRERRNKLRSKKGKTEAEKARMDAYTKRMNERMARFNLYYFDKIVMEDLYRLLDSAYMTLTGQVSDDMVREMPIVRKFYGLAKEDPQTGQRYYDLSTRMELLTKQRDLMKAAHDMEAYDTFMDTEGDMWTTGVMARYNSTEKHVRKIRERRNKLRSKKGKTEAEKARMDAYTKRMNERMARFNLYYFDKIVMEDFQ